jgi:heptosyltransferase III
LSPAEFDNILLIQLRQLGDILLTTPAIRAVRHKYPSAQITFLSHGMGKLVLADNPFLNHHLVLPEDKSSFFEKLSFYKNLRDRKYDLVVDFMGNPRSALLSRWTGAVTRASFSSTRNWAYNVVAARESGADYIVLEKFRILEKIGINANDIRLTLPWGNREFNSIEQYFSSSVNSNRLRVCLSPTHRRENRKWPKEYWSQLAQWIVNTLGGEVFWLWGPGELTEVSEYQAMCIAETKLAPKTSFRELAAFIAQTDLFIGNSNGPSHVAVSVNTPSIQLHGHTDAPSWCPLTPRHKAIQGKGKMDMELSKVQKNVLEILEHLNSQNSSRNLIRSSDEVWTMRPIL